MLRLLAPARPPLRQPRPGTAYSPASLHSLHAGPAHSARALRAAAAGSCCGRHPRSCTSSRPWEASEMREGGAW